MELGGPFLFPEEVQEVLRHSTATNKGGFILNGQATWSLVPGGLVVTSVPSGELCVDLSYFVSIFSYICTCLGMRGVHVTYLSILAS